jgi:hypothetical protein
VLILRYTISGSLLGYKALSNFPIIDLCARVETFLPGSGRHPATKVLQRTDLTGKRPFFVSTPDGKGNFNKDNRCDSVVDP